MEKKKKKIGLMVASNLADIHNEEHLFCLPSLIRNEWETLVV